MAKCILISIKHRYVADILNHKKTIEVRKSMPKCDLPIDVYIYCTKDKKSKVFGFADRYPVDFITSDRHRDTGLSGYVVAKFTLNKVEEIRFDDNEVQRKACLTEDELFDYLFVNEPYHEDMKKGYAWHISNLEIFDKPKELSEFQGTCKSCAAIKVCKLDRNKCDKHIKKAPQSFCYVEVEK